MTPAEALADEVDWADLAEALRRFAAATGLCVSAYDTTGRRRLGPYFSSRVAALLESSGAFQDDGAATALEIGLARTALDDGSAPRTAVDGMLQVLARPIALGERRVGAVVFGWVFCTFSTSLGCQQIARTLRLDAVRLWSEARLETPTAEARLIVSMQLLETLLDSMERHAQAMQHLHDLARMREGFLARVSHELRTPLSALLVRTDILLRSALDDPARVRGELEKMKRHIAEEARLVEDLIEAARTKTGQLSISRRPTLLAPIIGRALDLVRPVGEAKDVGVHGPADADLARVAVLADPDRLQQVMWNLLSNAVKFTPARGLVRVTVHTTERTVHIAVSDNGAGIDAAVLPLVFEPFMKKAEGNAQGLGLGLSIAKHIVEQHGGSISVRSDGPSTGSTFHIELPRHRDLRAESAS